jgi:hypothetical protein
VLSEAAVENDVIQIYTLKNFRVPNTYTIGQTDDQFLTKTSASNTYIPLSSPVTSFKNKIINGDFKIWQRGTSFSNPASGVYNADRFFTGHDGTGATRTISQQAFALGNIIPGYEPQFFYRYNQSVAGTSGTFLNILSQRVEDVRTFAGQTITFSFWAKADAAKTLVPVLGQYFGTGGSTTVYTSLTSQNITTSWARYSITTTVPSISGKTIGTGLVAFEINLTTTPNTTFTFDIWGVQVEKGSIATEFEQRFIGDELRLCQRYYHRITSTSGSQPFLNGHNPTTTSFFGVYNFPVSMRIPPTSIDTTGTAGDYHITHSNTNTTCNAVPTLQESTTLTAGVRATVASGLTAGHGSAMRNQNAVVYLGWSAEL